MNSDFNNISSDIRSFALNLGFDKIGFAKAEKLVSENSNFSKWIHTGYHASMNYMERNAEKREDISQILPGVNTVIVTAMNYFAGNHSKIDNHQGKIARYAWSNDYHDVLLEKLEIISDFIKTKYQKNSKAYVDTGPILEKAWAVKAGIGWQGKNSLILSQGLGSYFFLGIILTEMSLDFDQPLDEHCGNCRKCVEACPTGAIVEDKVVDSNKCISYWTIEAKPHLQFPSDISKNLNGWLFGCDICQEVCPWNKKIKFTKEFSFYDIKYPPSPQLNELDNMNEEEFLNRFKGTPIKRLKLAGLLRNINELKNNELL